MDWTDPYRPPLFLHTFSVPWCNVGYGITTKAAVSTTWASANKALYIPFFNPYFYPVNRVYWGNGSAVGNMDFGIYTADGVKIYSTGSTAQSGASALQYVTPGTTFLLPPGRYYFALVNDGTTNRVWCAAASPASVPGQMGVLQEGTALPLPAAMTPARTTSTHIPLCGITKTTTGF